VQNGNNVTIAGSANVILKELYMKSDTFEMQLACEVKEINIKIEQVINNNRKNKKRNDALRYYKGIQIYFSPVIRKPTMLIMGINPGQGYSEAYSKTVQRYYPLRAHEYLRFDYKLATDVYTIFQNIGKLDILEKSVKSNYYYIATKGQKEFRSLMITLPDGIKKEVESKSEKWTRDLIEYVEPSFILCEGFESFNKLNNLYGITQIERGFGWRTGRIAKIKIVSFARRYSTIINKKMTEKKVAECIEAVS
jgi:hypothetical protein